LPTEPTGLMSGGAASAIAESSTAESATLVSGSRVSRMAVSLRRVSGRAAWFERSVRSMKQAFSAAAVADVDNFAAGQRAGVTVNNRFHFNGNVWAVVTGVPDFFRKPAFCAVQLFTRHVVGEAIGCTVEGSTSYTSNIPDQPAVPTVACCAFRDGTFYQALLVNRSRSTPQSVTIGRDLSLLASVTLGSANINDSNEQVTLRAQSLGGGALRQLTITRPPFSAGTGGVAALFAALLFVLRRRPNPSRS